jgi:hypothetical protein
MNITEAVVQFLEKLITQFTWRRFSLALIIIFLLASLAFLFETYTGYFRLNKIERETKLLMQLTELSQKTREENNDKLTNLSHSVIEEFEVYINHRFPVLAFNLHPAILKAVAAAFPWVLMFFFFFISGPTQKEAFFGTLVIAIFFIGIGVALPSYVNSSINYFWYPIGHFLFIVLAVVIWQKRKAKP